ncbi:protein-L-isoaspartate(D-aspartate) O-methyltransferase [Streptomyces pilosus]|uniref:protein-L-isoaspartate(D-aspartate) O-methyltransferase n=1 Tax=Streptomyces pilosus TaxID=28893 RepID=UPI0036FB98C4
MDWQAHARTLAAQIVRPESRWFEPLATTPRHTLVPRWWDNIEGQWALQDGAKDPGKWLDVVYSDRTLVTRVGPVHADAAPPGTVLEGLPTSSSTLPGLVIQMFRHAVIDDTSQVLVTTGSGYGTALACQRLGEQRVTSIDIDPGLVATARERLNLLGLRPDMKVCDITGKLPGTYDRIVSTVSVRPVPASWLTALRPGGRLVTTIAGTGLILAADKTEDGGAVGRVMPDPAGFMRTRKGDDYDNPTREVWETAQHADGDSVSVSRYPLLYVPDSWAVMSMLALDVPGIDHRVHEDGDQRTVCMLHPDGSWARATSGGFLEGPTVHQGGPQRLWDALERIRNRLNREGQLPVYGARVTITANGETTLSRGGWTVTL